MSLRDFLIVMKTNRLGYEIVRARSHEHAMKKHARDYKKANGVIIGKGKHKIIGDWSWLISDNPLDLQRYAENKYRKRYFEALAGGEGRVRFNTAMQVVKPGFTIEYKGECDGDKMNYHYRHVTHHHAHGDVDLYFFIAQSSFEDDHYGASISCKVTPEEFATGFVNFDPNERRNPVTCADFATPEMRLAAIRAVTHKWSLSATYDLMADPQMIFHFENEDDAVMFKLKAAQ
jgi:hypothetical protein